MPSKMEVPLLSRNIAIVVTMLLVMIGLLHVVWGFGSFWPANDAEQFMSTFVGDPGPVPPQLLSLLFGLIFMAMGVMFSLWAWEKELPGPRKLWQILMIAIVSIFALRGLAGYLPVFAGSLDPFMTLNRQLYSPLCIIIALAGTIILVRRQP